MPTVRSVTAVSVPDGLYTKCSLAALASTVLCSQTAQFVCLLTLVTISAHIFYLTNRITRHVTAAAQRSPPVGIQTWQVDCCAPCCLCDVDVQLVKLNIFRSSSMSPLLPFMIQHARAPIRNGTVPMWRKRGPPSPCVLCCH